MDFPIILMILAFLGLIGIAGFLLFNDARQKAHADAQKKTASARQGAEPDPLIKLQKRISADEEKIKTLEEDLKKTRHEFNEALEREKALLKEKSQIAFDTLRYEKFKKEHEMLKREAAAKEKIVEEEISLRRKQAADLAQLQKEHASLKKTSSETEDALRKSQAALERAAQEMQTAKKMIADQKKIVEAHSADKKEGEWVSRQEFEKVEHELREKETMLQKLLSLKAQTPAAKGET